MITAPFFICFKFSTTTCRQGEKGRCWPEPCGIVLVSLTNDESLTIVTMDDSTDCERRKRRRKSNEARRDTCSVLPPPT